MTLRYAYEAAKKEFPSFKFGLEKVVSRKDNIGSVIACFPGDISKYNMESLSDARITFTINGNLAVHIKYYEEKDEVRKEYLFGSRTEGKKCKDWEEVLEMVSNNLKK